MRFGYIYMSYMLFYRTPSCYRYLRGVYKNACVYTVGPKQSKMSNTSYFSAHYITMREISCLKQLMLSYLCFTCYPKMKSVLLSCKVRHQK